jgi:hypothetical protein
MDSGRVPWEDLKVPRGSCGRAYVIVLRKVETNRSSNSSQKYLTNSGVAANFTKTTDAIIARINTATIIAIAALDHFTSLIWETKTDSAQNSCWLPEARPDLVPTNRFPTNAFGPGPWYRILERASATDVWQWNYWYTASNTKTVVDDTTRKLNCARLCEELNDVCSWRTELSNAQWGAAQWFESKFSGHSQE